MGYSLNLGGTYVFLSKQRRWSKNDNWLSCLQGQNLIDNVSFSLPEHRTKMFLDNNGLLTVLSHRVSQNICLWKRVNRKRPPLFQTRLETPPRLGIKGISFDSRWVGGDFNVWEGKHSSFGRVLNWHQHQSEENCPVYSKLLWCPNGSNQSPSRLTYNTDFTRTRLSGTCWEEVQDAYLNKKRCMKLVWNKSFVLIFSLCLHSISRVVKFRRK